MSPRIGLVRIESGPTVRQIRLARKLHVSFRSKDSGRKNSVAILRILLSFFLLSLQPNRYKSLGLVNKDGTQASQRFAVRKWWCRSRWRVCKERSVFKCVEKNSLEIHVAHLLLICLQDIVPHRFFMSMEVVFLKVSLLKRGPIRRFYPFLGRSCNWKDQN